MSIFWLNVCCTVNDFLPLLGVNVSGSQHLSTSGDGDVLFLSLGPLVVSLPSKMLAFPLTHFQFQEQILKMQKHNWHHCYHLCNSIV